MELLMLLGLIIGLVWGVTKLTPRGKGPQADQSEAGSIRPAPKQLPKKTPEQKTTISLDPKVSLPRFPYNMELIGEAAVIDGDTISIRGTKIRLSGIDTPELETPLGQKSKWALVSICHGQVVKAVLNGERSHDRLVGTCFLPDGRDVGAELIKRGLALDEPVFSGGKYRALEPDGARKRLMRGRFTPVCLSKHQPI